jgi:hypothetical protein
MHKVIPLKQIPPNSIIQENFGRIDYFDSYKITHPTHLSIDKIATELFRTTRPIALLMKIRNTLAQPFGLAIPSPEAPEQTHYPAGSKLTIFTVSARNENEIVIEENDKHLHFRASVLINRENSEIYLTTLVKYNHWAGRLYFIPVKPIHKIIIPHQLKHCP